MREALAWALLALGWLGSAVGCWLLWGDGAGILVLSLGVFALGVSIAGLANLAIVARDGRLWYRAKDESGKRTG